jgi:hypothetical protein
MPARIPFGHVLNMKPSTLALSLHLPRWLTVAAFHRLLPVVSGLAIAVREHTGGLFSL